MELFHPTLEIQKSVLGFKLKIKYYTGQFILIIELVCFDCWVPPYIPLIPFFSAWLNDGEK